VKEEPALLEFTLALLGLSPSAEVAFLDESYFAGASLADASSSFLAGAPSSAAVSDLSSEDLAFSDDSVPDSSVFLALGSESSLVDFSCFLSDLSPELESAAPPDSRVLESSSLADLAAAEAASDSDLDSAWFFLASS